MSSFKASPTCCWSESHGWGCAGCVSDSELNRQGPDPVELGLTLGLVTEVLRGQPRARRSASWFISESTRYLLGLSFSNVTATGSVSTADRAFGSDRIYLCRPVRRPPVTCGCWALGMWPVRLRNWILNFILINLNLNQWPHVANSYCVGQCSAALDGLNVCLMVFSGLRNLFWLTLGVLVFIFL